MPTLLTSLDVVKTIFGIPTTDTSQDALLNSYIQRASAAITNYCHRADFGLAPYTRVLSGNNTPALVVPDVPPQGITLTGNTTSGSAVITGLPTTGTVNASNLFLYQSVSGSGIPQGAIISDVSQLGSGQITISTNNAGTLTSAPATATATGVSLQFGIALWSDPNAAAGTAFGSFALSTLLQEGADYNPDYDNGPGGTFNSGIIYRIGYYWFRAATWFYDLVTPQVGPPLKNLQVQYLAGYTSIPYDVQEACENYIANARTTRKWGIGVGSMSNAGMSVSLGSDKMDLGLFTPYVRNLLAPYVVNQLPGA